MPAHSEFVAIALDAGSWSLPESQYRVERGATLLYQIATNSELNLTIDQKQPTRGCSAFQTDLCVYEERQVAPRKAGNPFMISIPRVVIEFKTKITTHNDVRP